MSMSKSKMMRPVVVVVACCALLVSASPHIPDPIVRGTELEFAFMIHRHGDRTPVLSTLHYSNDPATLTRLSQPYGWGQLTDVGKRRAFAMGQDLRKRYDSLLGPRFNRSDIYIRSTDSTRAKMTILAALAAMYPPGPNSWNNRLRWEPIPYTTVPAKFDFNLAAINCPELMQAVNRLYSARSPGLDQYTEVFQLLTEKTGVDINHYSALTYIIYDVFKAQLSLGVPLDPEVQAILPDIEKAAGEAIDILLGQDAYTPMGAGVLLNEFLKYAVAVANGEATHKFRIYSAHDVSVYAFEAVTQVANRQGVPKYASVYSLELRRVVRTGEYVILPVYFPSPGENPIYLQIAGCDRLCNLEQFINITSPFARDEETWRTECGFSYDMPFDDSAVA